MPAAIRNFLTPVFIISALFGCSKEDDSPAVMTADKTVVKLIAPTDPATVDPCCTLFSWESQEAGNFRFTLSENENFTSLLADSVLSTTSFRYNSELKPGKNYYWRVTQGANQANAAFQVSDVLAGLKQEYTNVPVRKYTWTAINGIESDTTLAGTVKILRVADKVRLQYTPDNIDQTMEMRQIGSGNTLEYFSPFYGTNGGHFTYSYKNDSIYFTNKTGGMGGGTVWSLSIKK